LLTIVGGTAARRVGTGARRVGTGARRSAALHPCPPLGTGARRSASVKITP